MKLDRRILSHLFIGVDIDLFYYRIVVFLLPSFYETQSIHMECK